MGKSLMWSSLEFNGGTATFSRFDRVPRGALAVPPKILFESGGGRQPWLTMGIEFVSDSPECTYLELDADGANPVRDKHIKLVHIENWVNQIVKACSDVIEEQGPTSRVIGRRPMTPKEAKAIDRMQRRRRDPNDMELMKQVASIYKDNPTKPIKAIMAAFPDMSESTAKRWARRCSENDLLPKVSKKGQKRI